jgi:hypothetical protein
MPFALKAHIKVSTIRVDRSAIALPLVASQSDFTSWRIAFEPGGQVNSEAK